MKKVFIFICLVPALLFVQGRDMDLESMHKAALEAYKTQPLDSARVVALNYLKMTKSANDKVYQVKAYFLLAYICSKTEEFGDAIIYYLEAARNGEALETDEAKKELISIYKNLANILGNYRHYELAHQFNEKSIELAEAFDHIPQIISLTENKISDLLEEEKFERALEEIAKIETRFQEEINMKSKILLKNMEGIAYKNLKKYDLAKDSYHFILNQETLDEKIYSYALHNMGALYFRSSQIDMAIEYFHKAIKFKKDHNLQSGLLLSLKDLADTYYTIGQNELALKYLKQAEQVDQEEYIHNPDYHELYKLTSEVYDAIGEPQKALEYERIYTEKLEAFIAEQKKIEELDKKHNIQLLTQRYFDLLAAEEKRRETERLAKLGLGGSGVLVIIIFAILLRQWWTRISIQRQIRDIEINSKV